MGEPPLKCDGAFFEFGLGASEFHGTPTRTRVTPSDLKIASVPAPSTLRIASSWMIASSFEEADPVAGAGHMPPTVAISTANWIRRLIRSMKKEPI